MPITTITEKIWIDIGCVPRNPVMLKWLGTTGSWNFWVFGINQVEGLTTTAKDTFQKFIEDLSLADTDTDYLYKTAVPEMILGADGLSSYKLSGIKTLLSSPKVMMLMNPETWQAEGEKWQTVRVVPAKYVIRETKASLSKIEFTIQLIQINNQLM